MNVKQITIDGLWAKNPALVQMLGLCPLLAVSSTLATSIGLGLTTLVVLTLSNFTISVIRKLLVRETRLPMQIMVIATFVTLADILLQAWVFELHQRIGLFVALIVTNCTLLGRAEAFASRQPVRLALLDGFMMGLGFMLVIMLLGGVREIIGQGTLFAKMHLLIPGLDMTIHLADQGMLLAVLPPGAFIIFGCLIAAKNRLVHLAGQTSGGADELTETP